MGENANQRLIEGARDGDLDEVKNALEDSADINHELSLIHI